MAYSRFGKDSDLYIWHDGRQYNLIANAEQKNLPHVEKKYHDPAVLLRDLIDLKDKGYSITKYTMKRVKGDVDDES